MSNVNTLLSQRLKKGEHTSKMAAMAKQSAEGNLTSFSGVFSVSDLTPKEKNFLEEILKEYATGKEDLNYDLNALVSITSEVKAINNQAAILHGERIKRAHSILTRYRDGAFTAWLISTYGNRQTPYNFMQYFEFCESLPKPLRFQVENMPRQAVYTLASREGPFEKKQEIVENYNGETKAKLLALIRELFPLAKQDRRAQNFGELTIQGLKRLCVNLENTQAKVTKNQKTEITTLLKTLQSLLNNCKTS